VELLDWNFASAPFFIESKYGGESLADWAEVHLKGLDTQGRIAVFLQVADAVAAAHSVGVLHKDLKPANVLVQGDHERHEIRLTDFGSGQIVEPDVLAQLGITNMGLTVDYRGLADSTSGTPFYLAPELLTGHAPTVRSDVYALGILLYQLLSGRIGQPMASGWEQDIPDPLLREDLQRATAGVPLQRLASVHELTTRLRDLAGRAAQTKLLQSERAEIEAAKQRIAIADARRPYLIGLVAALLVGVAVSSWLAQSATRSTERAETALAETRALNDFLRQDLISRSNPAVMAQGSSVPLKNVLLSAKAKIPERFAAQPRIRANVHHSLAELFSAIDQWPDAEAEARYALSLHRQSGSMASLDAQFAQSTLAIALARQGEFAESDSVIAALSSFISSQDTSDAQRFLLSHARAVNLFTKGSYAASVPEYALALDALARSQPRNVGLINSVRRDQIHAQTVAGQYASAEANADAFLRELATRPGDQSLWIALIKRVSARSVGYQNRLDEAVTLLSEAEPAIREGFGTGSEQWLSLQNELMAVSMRQRHYERALYIAEKLHLAARDQHSDDHPQVAKTRATWGFIAYEAERDEQAYGLLKPSCAALSRQLGDKGALAQNCFVQLALAQVASGRMDEAEATLNKLDFNVLGSYRAVAEQRIVITSGLQGLVDLSRGDPSGREKVAVAIAAFETSAQPKDRFYRLLTAAAAGAT
jgi:non-specific serine/threonine protein kinase